MRTAVAATVVLVLCLALALAQTPPTFALSNVDDTKDGVVPSCVPVLEVSSRNLVPDLVLNHRRSLKKGSRVKAAKWKPGQPTFLGTVITVAVVVALVIIFVLFVLITEKKIQDPKWRVRDMFKRRLKPGVKRTLTRRFTRKTAGGEDIVGVEKPKMVEDGVPPKV